MCRDCTSAHSLYAACMHCTAYSKNALYVTERIDEVCEAGRLGKSDHTVIITKVSIGVSMEEEKSLPDWRRADWDAMRADMKTGVEKWKA
jgi:hypothetical protein